MPSCNLRKGDFERNCVGHFDLTMIFCFFPSMSFVSTLGHPSKALRGPSKSLTFSSPRSKVGAFPDVYKNLVPWFSRLKAGGSKVN